MLVFPSFYQNNQCLVNSYRLNREYPFNDISCILNDTLTLPSMDVPYYNILFIL